MKKNSSARPVAFTKFQFPNLAAGFTSKKDGVFSSKVLKKLTVKKLTRRISQSFSRDCHVVSLLAMTKKFYFMEQIHGTNVVILDPSVTPEDRISFIKNADGLITSQKGILLIVKTADCLPVLIFDSKKQVIAAVHSGWRGTVGRIVLKAILKMVNEFGCSPQDLLVGIGPCAHKCCYRHDEKAFVKHLPEWQDFLEKKNGFWYIDLVSKVKHDLIDVGIKEKNIEIVPICTICDKRFFSYTKFKRAEEKRGCFITYLGICR